MNAVTPTIRAAACIECGADASGGVRGFCVSCRPNSWQIGAMNRADILDELEHPRTIAEVSRAIGVCIGTVKQVLRKLEDAGEVKRVGRRRRGPREPGAPQRLWQRAPECGEAPDPDAWV
mgnify:FL=1